MAANVVFPFAVALAARIGDAALAERARVGVSGIARSAIEPDHPRDDAAAWPDETSRRSGGAAGTASSLGQLVSREGLRALPLQSAPDFSEYPIGNRGLIRYDVCAASKEMRLHLAQSNLIIIIVIVKVRRGLLESRVWKRKINLFLLAIPIVLLNTQLHVAEWISEHLGLPGEPVLLVVAALGLIPLAGFVESAVEELAELLGPFIGGLLHTTFSNVAELFIALNILLTFAAPEGPEIVLSSVAGVIIRNSLLFLGVATFLGCLKNGTDEVQRRACR